MPLRSNGTLRVGIGLILGICLAGSGCQSQPVSNGLAAGDLEGNIPTAPPPTVNEPVSQNAVQSGKKQDGFFNGPIVKMLRPRPTQPAPTTNDAGTASAWQAQNRPGAEQVPASENATIQRVQAVSSDAAPERPGDLTPALRSTVDGQPSLGAPVAQAIATPEVESHVAPAGHLYAVHQMAALPAPREGEKQTLPPYVIEPPDILLIRASRAITLPTQPLDGQHLVKMDGYVNLGIYGEVYLAGHTLEQARDIVAQALLNRRVKGKNPDDKDSKATELTLDDIKKELQVDVLAFNSKFYFIIIDGGGYGERVYRIPFTGNETVLDAFSQIGGIPEVSSKRNMWIARSTTHDSNHPAILPIDWRGVSQCAESKTNYQLYPGDRIYVKADKLICIDNWLGKFLNPIDRVFGSVLLGASTVDTIKSGSVGGGGVP